MNTLICFYSVYGHVFSLAKAVAEGVKSAGGIPVLRTVPETLPDTVLQKIGALPPAERGGDLPLAGMDDLTGAGAIIFGSPTRFGGMCAQVRAFLDSTGALWAKGALEGKIGSSFTSTSTQHGGQEATQLSFTTFFLHHGMLVGGVPFSHKGLHGIELSGGAPYGAGAIADSDGSRTVSENELGIARRQGEFITELALKLAH